MKIRHHKKHSRTVQEGYSAAHGDQGIHIRRTVNNALKPAYKEPLIYDHDRNAQKHLYYSHLHGIVPYHRRKRKSEHGMPH